MGLKKDGVCTYTSSEGPARYSGSFKDDCFEGYGEKYDVSNDLFYLGVSVSGSFLSSYSEQFSRR